MTRLKRYIPLFLVIALGTFLRFYRLNTNNPAVYADETGHYFIPYIYNSLIYKTFSFTWLFGLTPLGVRAASAFYGVLLIIVSYWLAKTLNNKMVYIYPLLMAIVPWGIAISRLGHTHIPIVILLSLVHLILFLNSRNFLQTLISLVPYIVGVYYYPTLIVMLPFTLLIPLITLTQQSGRYRSLVYGSIAGIFLVCMYLLVSKYDILNPQKRGLDLAIWRDVNVTADSNLYRGLARLSEPTIFSFYQDPEKIANKIVFNYPLSVISVFFKNYLSFFSPDFLFLKGDNVLRHSTGMVGNFYLYLLPFMLYGAFVFFSSKNPEPRTKNKELFLLWILASPLPAAITKDGATYLLRAITMMPFLTYFCALGIVEVFELFKNKFQKIVFGVALGIVALYSSYYYFYGYFHVYPALAADSFEYGFKELTEFQDKHPGKLLIIWDDKYPYSHFCFWQNLPYELCAPDKIKTREYLGSSRIDLPLPNVIFSLPVSVSDLELITKNYELSYVAIPKKYTKNFEDWSARRKPVEIINNPDLTPAFKIYQINNLDN